MKTLMMRAAMAVIPLLTVVGLFCGIARAQSLPSELPLPPGVNVVGRVDHVDYGQDDFSHPNPQGPWTHVSIAGQQWRAFIKGDAKSLGVPAWKAALAQAGWQVLSEREGAMIARHGDWWAKIGLDRLTLIQHVEAAPFDLTPPGEKAEAPEPNQDLPYLAPLPNTARKAWKREDQIEIKGTKDPETRLLGPAVFLRYEGAQNLSGLETQVRYSAALGRAGWDVVRSDAGGVTEAHYTRHGRDVWVRITPFGGAYTIEVADMGIAAEQDKLAKALQDEGHVALYGIYFDVDKATLRPDSEATLVQVQKLLASHPAMKIEIQGHTDNTGARPHNQTLSEDRAASVKAWLVAHQIDAARLTAKGYADTKPVADNKTDQGRALNRRVELARQ